MSFQIINKILLFSCLVLANTSFSQNSLDSLISEFHGTDNEMNKINCLLSIGDLVYDHNMDSSELVWHQALIMSNKTLDENHNFSDKEIEFLKSESLRKLGGLHDFLGHYEIGIENLNQSLEIKKRINDTLNIYDVYTDLSLAHFHTGDYKIAMFYSNQNLEHYESQNQAMKIASSCYDIAYIYLKLGEHSKSKEYFDRALNIYKSKEDYYEEAYVLSGISEYYISISDWELAEFQAMQSIVLFNQLGEQQAISIPYSLMGLIKIEKYEFDSAFYYLNLSESIQSPNGDIQKSLENNTYYSILYSRKGNSTKALEYANKVLDLALSVEDKTHEKDAFELLYKIYEEKKDYKNAFFYYKNYNQVENYLSVGESRRLLLQTELEFENEQQRIEDSLRIENIASIKESEKNAHDAEMKAERRTNALLFGGVGVLFLAMIMFFRSNRINKRNNLIISAQNRKLNSKATLYKILKVCSSEEALMLILQDVLNELVEVPWFAEHRKAYIFILDETDNYVLKANINYQKATLIPSDFEKREIELTTEAGAKLYHIPIVHENELLGIMKLFLEDEHESSEDEVNFLESIALLLGETLQRVIIEKKLRLAHMENTLKKKEIELAHKEVSTQNKLLERLNKEVTQSITYAKRIQQAILPDKEYLDSIFPNQFIMFCPKDIVGGDLYWVREYDDNYKMIACIDCSGHGIPGAFMTMLSRLLLREIVTIQGERDPAIILKKMDIALRKVLKQTSYDSMQDGMDMSLCMIDTKRNEISFSMALRPVLLRRKNYDIVEKLTPSKFPIGGYFEMDKVFERLTFDLDEIDSFFMYSDGYTDQFGGPNRKKFGTNQFISLVNSILDKDTKEQKEIIVQKYYDWQGETDQIDDILVMGVKL